METVQGGVPPYGVKETLVVNQSIQSGRLSISICRKRRHATTMMASLRVFKGALYRIWCGMNRLGDSGAKVV